MTDEQLKKVLNEVLEDHHATFYVEAEKHYQHHQQMELCQASKPEWEANHEFISKWRSNTDTAKTVTLKFILTAALGLLITLIVRGWNG